MYVEDYLQESNELTSADLVRAYHRDLQMKFKMDEKDIDALYHDVEYMFDYACSKAMVSPTDHKRVADLYELLSYQHLENVFGICMSTKPNGGSMGYTGFKEETLKGFVNQWIFSTPAIEEHQEGINNEEATEDA